MTAVLKWLNSHKDIIVVMATVIGLWGYNYGSNVHTQNVQEQQSQIIQKKICHTLDALAQLHPPSGNAISDPLLGYEQNIHTTLAQLGPDVGCS